MTMRTSADGLSVIKEFEGLRLSAYRCPARILTIGYGHTSAAGDPKVTSGLVISRDDAERILRNDLKQYEDAVSKAVKAKITQSQFDALVCFTYNVGAGALAKSTLIKKINAERLDEVPAEFMKWTRGGGKELPGLVRRRRAEVKLWRGLTDDDTVPISETRFTPDAPRPKKTIIQSKEANGAAIAGGAGAIAVIQELAPIIRDGGNLLSSLSPTMIALIVVVFAAAAVWYFRKQRLEEDGL